MRVDTSQVRQETLGGEEVVVIPVVVPVAEVAATLVGYDPSETFSPSAGDSRKAARVVLDALRAQQGL